MNKKFVCHLFAALGLLSLLAWTNPIEKTDFVNSHLDEQEEIIRERIPTVVSLVSPIYNPAVRSYLNTYIYRRPEGTANMLGWAKYYFPKFEKALAEEGLPTDLKYLAIVESALNPNAISRSGAGGLWQFMKPTARECGLKCGTYVDERMDPEKSSKAAARYLKQLYNMFGNWELVMAAYNAGPGRIRSAVKRAGTNDYWKLARYLPLETRSYVPGFIAASYLANFHAEHNVIPVDPSHALGEMGNILLFEGMSLSELARRSGLTVDVVKSLNPSFVRNYIPASTSGYTIYLPIAAIELFNSGRSMEAPPVVDESLTESALMDPDAKVVIISGERWAVKTIKKHYTVRSGDNLYTLANKNNCTVKQLMSWNRLKSTRLAIGQRLEFRKEVRELIPEIVEIAPPPPAPVARQDLSLKTLPTLLSDAITIDDESPTVSFSIKANIPEQGDNTLVLKRRQSIRSAYQSVQLGSSVQPSQIIMPAQLGTGDVVRFKSRT